MSVKIPSQIKRPVYHRACLIKTHSSHWIAFKRFVQAIVSDKRIAEMTASIPYPYPETGAIDWISTHEKRWSSRENVSFAILLKSTDTIIGAIGLAFKESNEGELGYWLGVDYWG